ncbi:MAG TPA: hypothetical protein VIJ29_03530 [Candidatus Paceibacterota bacterium]
MSGEANITPPTKQKVDVTKTLFNVLKLLLIVFAVIAVIGIIYLVGAMFYLGTHVI